MNNLTLRIGRDGTLYDYSELFTKATFSGRKGAAPRTIDMTIADVEKIAAANINCGNGQECYLYLNGNEIFRGLLMNDGRNNKNNIPIKAYDDCVRLCNIFSKKKRKNWGFPLEAPLRQDTGSLNW